MREITACFSGHRPEKLPGKGIWNDRRTKIIKSLLYFKIYNSIQDGYINFISGLARGIDLWSAMMVLDFKKLYPDITLICVKPTPQHGESFRGEDRFMFQHVVACADEIICTGEHYHKGCYNIRNRYMIDASSKLIAVINSYTSGTGYTINYAKKSGLKIDLIDADEINTAYEEYYNTK